MLLESSAKHPSHILNFFNYIFKFLVSIWFLDPKICNYNIEHLLTMYYNANISTKSNYLKTPKVRAWVGEIST